MKFSKKETTCIGLHLRAQHRQAVYDEIADLGEPCEECPYLSDCKSDKEYLWLALYKKICNQCDIEISFKESQYPLVPRQKQDTHNG